MDFDQNQKVVELAKWQSEFILQHIYPDEGTSQRLELHQYTNRTGT